MEPFKIPDQMARLRGTYLSVEDLLCAVRDCGRPGRVSIAQLWLSEGIPFAFAQCPALYAYVRLWLGARIDVDAKQIGIYGSGRLGKSLSPRKLGNSFDTNSDLDLFVVSKSYFGRLCNDYDLWSSDYRAGVVEPRTRRARVYWPDNLTRVKKTIALGFIDAKMIPSLFKYAVAQHTADSMWRLVEKLRSTSSGPTPRSASVRCYADWPSAIERMSLNLWAVRNAERSAAVQASAT